MRVVVALVAWLISSLSIAAAAPRRVLQAELAPGATSRVTVQLEVGGELLVPTEKEGTKKLPMKVAGGFEYSEQFTAWAADADAVVRSIRDYKTATARIDVESRTSERILPSDRRLLLAEARAGQSVITGAETRLTREQYDLVNIIGNTLAIDRLLPQREVAEGESWQHDATTIGPLLCMDHVGVCEVSSVVTEEADRQVKIRLAGTVHGTVDGTTTEMELRAAYVFDLDQKRITRFNLAVKEVRKASDIVPGIDAVAKAFVTIDPEPRPFAVSAAVQQHAERVIEPLARTLVYESPAKNYRFEYDAAWYITAEERDRLSFRYLHEHELGAHCNLSVLPARSAGRHTPLDQFEKDIRQSIGEPLEAVTAATEWETKQGNHCLGIIAEGKVNDVPIQWRNYLVSADDTPRLSLSVTLERSRSEQFADAERKIIDSIELVPTPVPVAASAGDAVSR